MNGCQLLQTILYHGWTLESTGICDLYRGSTEHSREEMSKLFLKSN